MAWDKKEIKEVFEELNSSPKGLSSEEVGKRLDQYGHNALKEKMVMISAIYHQVPILQKTTI
ncbi:MAG: hypothetical protein A2026_15180 [Deltaproteobacteria bacterium RBG_19FT_COMBO_46_12]|nr:MAG: hypothetical protein A2026_15180 [Deltaproteobacteria bacterium RBG_19FT_COMBO_46_12]